MFEYSYYSARFTSTHGLVLRMNNSLASYDKAKTLEEAYRAIDAYNETHSERFILMRTTVRSFDDEDGNLIRRETIEEAIGRYPE